MSGFANDAEPEDEENDDLPSSHDFGEDAEVEGAQPRSLEELRDHALRCFGTSMQRHTGKDIPPPPPEETHRYLPLEELDAIVQEHGQRADGGTVFGGDTREEAVERFREMMSAIQSRILSNILREAVQRGMLDCEFDPEANDFLFSVTDKVRERYGTGDEGRSAGP